VQTYQIHVSDGRARVDDVRSALFAFPEILDVFITGRPDTLVVVCAGRPHPALWLRRLRHVGYEVWIRRRPDPATSDARREPAPVRAVRPPTMCGDAPNSRSDVGESRLRRTSGLTEPWGQHPLCSDA
jgi:hypothetical protein